jgi:hypothetical protein
LLSAEFEAEPAWEIATILVEIDYGYIKYLGDRSEII